MEKTLSDKNRLLKRLAGKISKSRLFVHARKLYRKNESNWNISLSKFEKLQVGVYMILRDYASGDFPPVFEDQQAAYKGEEEKLKSLAGVTLKQSQTALMAKPFWGSTRFSNYASGFARLWKVFEELDIRPPSRLLELGCGSGWMAEFFGMAGYTVLGTTIASDEVAVADDRVRALDVKGCGGRVHYSVCPMESVDQVVEEPFDAVYVFEALHHAFDWRATLQAAHRSLKPGAWLIVAHEPNVLHTFISYRVARLSNTHEIGFRRRELLKGLRAAGFQEIRALSPRFNNLVSQHWIVGRK